jgi:predicted dehydrogenase
MKTRVDVALVGIGGYGAHNLEMVRRLEAEGRVRLNAVIDPMAEKSPDWPDLAAKSVPAFKTLTEFNTAGLSSDLAVISSPIAFHASQTCEALGLGMNVLCEKPMAATIQDALTMQAARNASGKFLEIGFQWSFGQSIQRLKSHILAGRLGAPLRLMTRVAWPRTNAYYARNSWAGRLRDESGRWVLDSPVNNATAHFLHNMLFVLGTSMDRCATPVSVTAEAYRANPIENYDAACCRVETQENVDLLFFTAHCVDETAGPIFQFLFENATVELSENGHITARFQDGSEVDYGHPESDPLCKLIHCVDQCFNETASSPLCGPEAAMGHVLCVNGIQQTPIHEFDPKWIERRTQTGGETLTFVSGLNEAMKQGVERSLLFSEMQLPWARPAMRIPLTDYVHYPSNR